MTYQDTVAWMFEQLPMYQNVGKSAYKKDLSNIVLLDTRLKSPHRNFKSIHVGGTNGKGSTSHILASVLQEAGYEVGLYTSPHLRDFRERIRINGATIDKNYVVDFIEKHRVFFEENNMSFFEMTVGMAFDYFANQKVDIAIIEVGLGGRLDSTNIITPELSVITNIGLDHTKFLGDTLALIAKEKAGIIKPEVPVIIGETHAATADVFIKTAKINNSEIIFADKADVQLYNSDLKGIYQKHNLQTARVAIDNLSKIGFDITEEAIKKGFHNVAKNTGLKGRWQILDKNPTVICDTAHNREALAYIVAQLNLGTFDDLHFVLGVVEDKDLSSILEILPKQAHYYCCKPNVIRGLDAKILHDALRKKGYSGQYFLSVSDALLAARNSASIKDLIYVGGSTFVVAEVV